MDVCIFCAARLRLASTRAAAGRRFLQSSSSRLKPAYGEVSQGQRLQGTTGDGGVLPIRYHETFKSHQFDPLKIKRYEKDSLSQLDSILKESDINPASPPRSIGLERVPAEKTIPYREGFFRRAQATANSRSGYYRPDWVCFDCGWRNRSRAEHCSKCEASRPPAGEWTCQQCKKTMSPADYKCRDCAGGVQAAGSSMKWDHLPKKGSNPGSDPQYATGRHVNSDEVQAANEERMKRRQATQAGGFVGVRRVDGSRRIDDRFSPERAQMYTPREEKYMPQNDRATRLDRRGAGTEGLEGLRDYGSFGDAFSTEEQNYEVKSDPKNSADLGFLGGGLAEKVNIPSINRMTPSMPSSTPSMTDSPSTRDPPRIPDPLPQRFEEADSWARKKQKRGSDFDATYVKSGQRRVDRRQGILKMEQQKEDDHDGDFDEEARAERAQRKKEAQKSRKLAAGPTKIHLPAFISVGNLAGLLRIYVAEFLKKMSDMGFDELAHDHILDAETAGLIAAEFNFEAVVDAGEENNLKAQPPTEDKSELPARPPVVTIMGHVDHGKTTMLDFLRKSSVAASEHGGITQHIGAFSVEMSGGRLVTFLDTPGHEAFLAMRQRGANVTDIVILVVAADDSVMPQTLEAIKHAQGAKVPVIVAVNKVDKPEANVSRVKQDLSRHGIEIEDYGGDTQVVCVSGKTGEGMSDLEEAITAQADILDMRATDTGPVEGWVLESTTKKAGRVATVLIRRGTLSLGDVIVAGTSWARVRSLRNEAGAPLTSAGPGFPAEIDGWRIEPSAGDEILQATSEQHAKSVIEHRQETISSRQNALDIAAVNEARKIEAERREAEKAAAEAEANGTAVADNEGADTTAAATANGSTPPLKKEEDLDDGAPKQLLIPFILKADVSGSLDALTDTLTTLSHPSIRPLILRSGVGPISEFDIDHAATAKGHIIAFNLPSLLGPLQREAEFKGVQVVEERIIYRVEGKVKELLAERLPVVVKKSVQGEAEVAAVFEINVRGRVRVAKAGCKVRNGDVTRGRKVRVMRGGGGGGEGEVVFDGPLSSLKHVKKDVDVVRKGSECGMGFEGWTDFQVGDQVQSYTEIVEKRTL